jgi:hypothetical protein
MGFALARGARTGTQGIVGAAERSRIPTGLFENLFHQVAAVMKIAA